MLDSDMGRGQSYIWQDETLSHRFSEHDFDLELCRDRFGGQLLSGGRGGSCRFGVAGLDCVLRVYLRGGMMQHLSRDQYLWTGLHATRPWREQQTVQRAQEFHLPVPRVLAYQVQRSGLQYRAAIISQFIQHRATLADFLGDQAMPKDQWQSLGELIRRMHDASIDHADLNANNILSTEASGFYLIDFDKARIRRSTGNWCRANLDRLLRSLNKIADANAAGGRAFHFEEKDWQALLQGYR